MPRILKLLDLSTAHLPFEVCQDLNAFEGVIADERPAGWLLWVPEDVDNWVEYKGEIPEAVAAIWRHAESNDCRYVLLDGDAEKDPDLPTYEW